MEGVMPTRLFAALVPSCPAAPTGGFTVTRQ
jgi:hypothetical protein